MPYSKVSPSNKMSTEKMPVNKSKKGIETQKHVPIVKKGSRNTAKVSK